MPVNYYINDEIDNLDERLDNIENNPGGGVPDLTATQIAFGDGVGKMTSSSYITFDIGNELLSVKHLSLNNLDVTSNNIPKIGDINENFYGDIIAIDSDNKTSYYDNILHDGKFGINTATPTVALDVVGDIAATASITGLTVKATQAAGYISSDGSTGATGSFEDANGLIVTVKDGIITSIV